MSAQAQESLQNTLDSIQAGTITSGYGSKDAYVRANYGPTMSYDKFVQIMERYYLAADYAQSQLDAYYEEHADELDTFTLSQFVFQARVNTVDDEGNTIEMTDEEKAAALEEEKAAVKEQAEALQARLEAGEDPEALGAALDFEFELPYPDGTRMGLSERARKAFEHRLGISIPRKEST